MDPWPVRAEAALARAAGASRPRPPASGYPTAGTTATSGDELQLIPSLVERDEVRELIQAELERVNAGYAKAEQIKKFTLLDRDLSREAGELTPTLEPKRNVVSDRYGDLFDGDVALSRGLAVA
jgi:long-subunit acyl-CoA synthetase (AMP-forming)